MLEKRLINMPKMFEHIFWTDKKHKECQEEFPNGYITPEFYNNWLENKFEKFKKQQFKMLREGI